MKPLEVDFGFVMDSVEDLLRVTALGGTQGEITFEPLAYYPNPEFHLCRTLVDQDLVDTVDYGKNTEIYIRVVEVSITSRFYITSMYQL